MKIRNILKLSLILGLGCIYIIILIYMREIVTRYQLIPEIEQVVLILTTLLLVIYYRVLTKE